MVRGGGRGQRREGRGQRRKGHGLMREDTRAGAWSEV